MTYRIVETGQIDITLDPFPEFHGIIGGVTFTVRGQAEDGQRFLDCFQLQQLFLQNERGLQPFAWGGGGNQIFFENKIFVTLNHIALLRIGNHSFQLISDALLGQSASKLFGRAGLRAIEHHQTAAGRLQFLDERVVHRLECIDLCWPAADWKCLALIAVSFFLVENIE